MIRLLGLGGYRPFFCLSLLIFFLVSDINTCMWDWVITVFSRPFLGFPCISCLSMIPQHLVLVLC